MGSGGATTEGAKAVGGKVSEKAVSGGIGFDSTRIGWYAAVLIPTAIIGWGVYDEESPPAKFSKYIGLSDQFDAFAKPARTKLLPDWSSVSCTYSEALILRFDVFCSQLM